MDWRPGSSNFKTYLRGHTLTVLAGGIIRRLRCDIPRDMPHGSANGNRDYSGEQALRIGSHLSHGTHI